MFVLQSPTFLPVREQVSGQCRYFDEEINMWLIMSMYKEGFARWEVQVVMKVRMQCVFAVSL